MKYILAILLSFGLVVSGFSQTRNVVVDTNGVVVQPTNIWTANATNARSGLGLGTAATNPASAFQSSSSVLSNLASSNGVNITNLRSTNIVGIIPSNNISMTSVSDVLAISNGGTGATNTGGARTNLGATTIGNTLFTATNSTVGKAALDLSPTSNITLNQVDVNTLFVSDGTNGIQFETSDVAAITRINLGIGAGATNTVGFGKIRMPSSGLVIEEPIDDVAVIAFPTDTDPVALSSIHWNHASVRQSLGFSTNLTSFWTSSNVAVARTNLGIPLAALTNTNNANFLAAFFGANTNPVLVNTNGEVVSPTNFWQASPANTRVQLSQPVVNATNSATNARNLYLYSLAISTTGVTNTIQLPTNGGTLLGDVATIIHEGPTSSITAVRQTGAGSNIITLNQFQEAVKFIYESAGWRLADNISYVEPIYFSGTNAAANAAESRTNLGLGATWLTNTNVTNFRTAIGLGVTNAVEFVSVGAVTASISDTFSVNVIDVESGGYIQFSGENEKSATRTNLGLGFPALTNTNAAGFQCAIFTTNAAPTNAGNFGNHAAWMGVSIVTNGVTNTFLIPLYQ